jgi:hypothetical protein
VPGGITRAGRCAEDAVRARFLAEFTLNGQSEIPRCARNDSEGLEMTRTETKSLKLYAARLSGLGGVICQDLWEVRIMGLKGAKHPRKGLLHGFNTARATVYPRGTY